MFGGKRKNSDFPIGLDVGDHGVRLLQLSKRGGKLTAVAAAQARLPEGLKAQSDAYHAAVAEAIGRSLAAGGFAGNRVVSALPASSMQCKNLRLPTMPADELAAAVQWEAADRFGFGDQQTSAQFLVAGEVRQGEETRQEIILLAAKLGFVEAHVAALIQNSLRPQAIDAVPAALARLTDTWATGTESPGPKTDTHVLIDVGYSATKVLIVRDGRVVFFKPIEIGGTHLDSVLSGSLSISLDEARQKREALETGDTNENQSVLSALLPPLNDLGREIGLCLRYYGVTFRGPRPETARLLGGGAAPWLVETLGQASGLQLELGGVFDGIDLSAVRGVIEPGSEHGWAVAAGLSLRHLNSAKQRQPSSEATQQEVAA
ncbi:MAG: pilus assembly protein PilM [Planctomycetota bacterium]